MKRAICWSVVLMFALFGSSAFAQGNSHGHGNGKGHGKGNPHNQAQADDDHDGRWEARNGWEYHTYDGGHRPPGWNKGKKTGWGNCNLPPGQAKKYGCNTYTYQNRRYYWYNDEAGRIVVRRPVISAHAGIEIH